MAWRHGCYLWHGCMGINDGMNVKYVMYAMDVMDVIYGMDAICSNDNMERMSD